MVAGQQGRGARPGWPRIQECPVIVRPRRAPLELRIPEEYLVIDVII